MNVLFEGLLLGSSMLREVQNVALCRSSLAQGQVCPIFTMPLSMPMRPVLPIQHVWDGDMDQWSGVKRKKRLESEGTGEDGRRWWAKTGSVGVRLGSKGLGRGAV